MKEQHIQELLQTRIGTEGSLLIPRKIYDTLWEAVEKKLIGRQFAAFIVGPDGVPGSSFDMNLATADSMTVYRVAEGAMSPIDVPTFTAINVVPRKYAVRPVITREMLEDGKWNLLEFAVKTAGKEMAENETAQILSTLDGAGNTVSGGATLSIANITRAIQYLRDSDFDPQVMVIGPEVLNDLQTLSAFSDASQYGNNQMMMNGFVGTIFGLKVFIVTPNASTQSAATQSRRAYVLDPSQAFCVVEKRPVTVEEYDDAVHDMQGVVITQRIGFSLIRSNAVTLITTS